MLRKFSALLILALIAAVPITYPAATVRAATLVSVSGIVDASDPVPPGTACHFDSKPFTVSVSGNYSPSNLLPAFTGANWWFIDINTATTGPVLGQLVAGNDGISHPKLLAAGQTYYFHITTCEALPLNYRFTFSGPGDICVEGCPSPAKQASVLPGPVFSDGRINNNDAAAPVAVYPHPVNGEMGLVIYSDSGALLLVVSPEDIAHAPETPDSNALVAEANGVSLYRLHSGEWAVFAPQYNGKTYVLTFTQFSPGGYQSYEEG